MYCTRDNIEFRLPPQQLDYLTTDPGSEEGDAEAVLDAMIRDAQSEIDGYLRGRYTLPLAGYPKTPESEDLLTVLACDIVKYNLYSRRNPDQVPETHRKRYEDAIKKLERISSGVIDLGVSTESDTPTPYFATNKRPCDRVFSMEKLKL